LSELAVDLLLYFLDRQPMAKEDERWGFVSDSLITNGFIILIILFNFLLN